MDCKYLFRFRVIPVILFIFAILYACSDDSSSGSRRSNSTSSQRAWYEGGTLHDAGALDWQNASYSNKLATCADIVCYYDSEGLLNPSISNRINSIDDFRPYADDLENSSAIQRLWSLYKKKFAYAEDLSWTEVMSSVNILFEIGRDITK